MEEIITYLIGRHIKDEDTVKVLENSKFRIVRRDKDNFIVTMDLRLDRLNLETDDGIITKAYIG